MRFTSLEELITAQHSYEIVPFGETSAHHWWCRNMAFRYFAMRVILNGRDLDKPLTHEEKNHVRKVKELLRRIAINGFDPTQLPEVRENVVSDGNTRLCYIQAMNLPCYVIRYTSVSSSVTTPTSAYDADGNTFQ